MIKPILLLGNPELYTISEAVLPNEVEGLAEAIGDLHDTLMAFRQTYGAGRAIAAPQIGIKKRFIYMHVDHPIVLFNPELHFPDEETMVVWDDCMSFPKLLVAVDRYKRVEVHYRDAQWALKTLFLEGDLAELIQHEYDHLDGILATMRAKDSQSFRMLPWIYMLSLNKCNLAFNVWIRGIILYAA